MRSNQFLCPRCEVTLRIPGPLPDGSKIRCPKCSSIIVLPNEDDPKVEETQPDPANSFSSTGHRPTPGRMPLRELEEKEEEEPRHHRPRPKSQLWILLVVLLCGGVGFVLLIGIVVWQVSDYLRVKPATDEPTYLLKIKTEGGVGKSIREQVHEKANVLTQVVDQKGAVVDTSRTTTEEELDYILSTFGTDERGATQLNVMFDKAIGRSGLEEYLKPYHGRRFFFEVMGNHLRPTAMGKPDLLEKDLKELVARVNVHRNRHMPNGVLYSKAVRVNETWPTNTQQYAVIMGNVLNAEFQGVKGEAKLLKVYEKEGNRFGVIEMKGSYLVHRFGPHKLDPPGSMETITILDCAIDGSSPEAKNQLTTKLTCHSQLDDKGGPISFRLTADETRTLERSAEFDTPPEHKFKP